MSTTTSHSLNLMACVRESSPQEPDQTRHEGKKKRFRALHRLRLMFRRKGRDGSSEASEGGVMGTHHEPRRTQLQPPDPQDQLRSLSASELLADQASATRRRSGVGLPGGLSVSHDSVFTAEGHSSSDHSASSLSIQQLVQNELLDAVRRRRGCPQQQQNDTSEDTDEDLGLPRSPACNSPTTADVLLDKSRFKENAKSQSTCSDGSLLSMGSSEMDEDSLGHHSGHSSKLSLHDKKVYQDHDMELDIPTVPTAPLSHSAARHKMAVRPKRTHGAPRRQRIQQIAAASSLPTTPEVNEDVSGRSVSPEVKPKKETTAENSSKTDCIESTAWSTDRTLAPLTTLPTEIQQKSASLPPGLALTPADSHAKLPRSQSNAACRVKEVPSKQYYKRTVSTSELDAGVSTAIALEALTKSREMFGTVGEEDEEDKKDLLAERMNQSDKDEKRDETTFFGRLLSRRSGKKKKEKSEEIMFPNNSSEHKNDEMVSVVPKRIDEKGCYSHEPFSDYIPQVLPSNHARHFVPRGFTKSSASSRQRVEPINLPPSPEFERKDVPTEDISLSPPPAIITANKYVSNDDSVEIMKETLTSASPPKPTWPSHHLPINIDSKPSNSDRGVESSEKTNEIIDEYEVKPNFRVTGYASNLHEEEKDEQGEREYSSLIHTNDDSDVPKLPVKKSHSFRANIEYDPPIPKIIPRVTNISFSTISSKTSELNPAAEARDLEETTVSYKSTISAKIKGEVVETQKTIDYKDLITNENGGVLESESSTDISKPNFINNIYVSTRSVIKEKTIENILTDLPVTEATKEPENVAKESCLQEDVNTDCLLNGNVEVNNEIDSLSNITQQVIMPGTSDGITITQNVCKPDENKNDSANGKTVPASDPQPILIDGLQVPVTHAQNEVREDRTRTSETIQNCDQSMTTAPVIQNLTPRSNFIKRDSRPIISPQPHVPEFLRVQLHKVDNKPVSNVIFKNDHLRNYSKNNEDKQFSKDEFADNDSIKRENIINESIQTLPNIVTGSLKEKETTEQISNLKESTENLGKIEYETSPVSNIVSQELKKFTPEPVLAPVIRARRSISLVPNSNNMNKNYSVVSISTEVSNDSTASRPPLRKHSSNIEASDIKILAKDTITSSEAENNKVPSKTDVVNFKEPEIILRKKSLQREIVLKKDEEGSSFNERHSSGRESVSSEASSVDYTFRNSRSKELFGSEIETNPNEIVVLRKKSKEIGLHKEEEPELLKVFARRSLKLKDSEIEVLGQQLSSSKNRDSQPTSEVQGTKSRDSDKENEGGDSPKEERKKQINKEPLAESKIHIESSEPSVKVTNVALTLNNNPRNGVPGAYKFQKSMSSNESANINEAVLSPYKKDNNMSPEKRLRNRTVPESPRTDNNYSISDKNSHRAWANLYKDKEIQITSTEAKPVVDKINTQTENIVNATEKEESNVPKFKRIQQRREEWELRAQLASKKTLP